MRTLALVASALFAAASVNAQTFPSIADFGRSLSILQPGMELQSIAVDSTGNVYLAGVSNTGASGGFAGATTRIGPLGQTDLFVIKTNATADQVVYATAIGGSGAESLRGIRVDASGNAYLVGSTVSSDLPFTSSITPTLPIGGFTLKLNATGTALTYAMQMGSRMTPVNFDVDANGAVYVVGATNVQDLATTTGVLKPSPGGSGNMGFIVKLNSTGTAFEIATYYGAADKSVEAISLRSGIILIVADGNLTQLHPALTQQLASVNIGLKHVRLAYDGLGNVYASGTAADDTSVLRRYSSPTLTVAFEKKLPLAGKTNPPQIAVTNSGRIYVFGEPTAANFPTLNASQTCLANRAAPEGIAGLPPVDSSGGITGTGQLIPPDQALMILDPTGNVLQATFTPMQVQQTMVGSNDRIYLAARETLFTLPRFTQWNGIVRLNSVIPASALAPSCLVHGALFTAAPIHPGGLMTFFGTNLGPATGVSFGLDANNIAQKVVGGVSVTVDGKPAPMLYASAGQINFIAPWSIRTDGVAVPVCVNYSGTTTCVQAGTGVALPGAITCYFPDQALTCALNQDSLVHQKSNPAAPGSVVQLFMSGFGTVDGPLVDGGIATLPLRRVNGTVSASTNPPATVPCGLFSCTANAASASQQDIEIGFAGAAPNLLLGVNQVNIRIPSDMPSGLQTFNVAFKPAGSTTTLNAAVQLWIR
jgi:uncharacterized protein (TIGR03437 family)